MRACPPVDVSATRVDFWIDWERHEPHLAIPQCWFGARYERLAEELSRVGCQIETGKCTSSQQPHIGTFIVWMCAPKSGYYNCLWHVGEWLPPNTSHQISPHYWRLHAKANNGILMQEQSQCMECLQWGGSWQTPNTWQCCYSFPTLLSHASVVLWGGPAGQGQHAYGF